MADKLAQTSEAWEEEVVDTPTPVAGQEPSDAHSKSDDEHMVVPHVLLHMLNSRFKINDKRNKI